MALFSSSSEFLVSSFLIVGSSFVGQGSPLCSVHGSLLQLFRFDVTPLEIGFDGVFVSQPWAALVSLAELELSIHQASWYPKFLHADYMPHPSKLGLDEQGLRDLVMRSCHFRPVARIFHGGVRTSRTGTK